MRKKKATSKAEEEKKSQDTLSPSEANGSTGKESSADDEGEDTETFYIRQRRKIKEAIDTLTSRVVKIGGSGIFLQDHVAFVSAICLELLGFDWEERTLLSRRVGCIEQRELCDIVSRKEDIFMPSLFPCEAVDIDEFPIPKSVQSWMSAEQWGRILEVSKLDVFANLPLNIKKFCTRIHKIVAHDHGLCRANVGRVSAAVECNPGFERQSALVACSVPERVHVQCLATSYLCRPRPRDA